MGKNKVGQATGLEIFHLLGTCLQIFLDAQICATPTIRQSNLRAGGLKCRYTISGFTRPCGYCFATWPILTPNSSPYGFCELFFLGLIRASERGDAHLSQVYREPATAVICPSRYALYGLFEFTLNLGLEIVEQGRAALRAFPSLFNRRM